MRWLVVSVVSLVIFFAWLFAGPRVDRCEQTTDRRAVRAYTAVNAHGVSVPVYREEIRFRCPGGDVWSRY